METTQQTILGNGEQKQKNFHHKHRNMQGMSLMMLKHTVKRVDIMNFVI